jgi:hypothetical protein
MGVAQRSVSDKNRVTATDPVLDAEIEAAIAAEKAERSLLEQDAQTSYWAALKLRCRLLTAASEDRAFQRKLAALPLASGRPPVLESRTDQLAACNRRLGWPYSPDATARPSAIAQALDGAVMVIEHARWLDQQMVPRWQRRIRWPLLAFGLIYGAARVGPRFLALLLLPLSGLAAGLTLGALSGITRPLLGTSWLGRIVRGTISGAVAGTLLMLPVPVAVGRILPGPLWMWLASGAIAGAMFGPIYQPRDDPYLHDSQ